MSDKARRRFYLAAWHIGGAALVIGLLTFWRCPIRLLFGMGCPGCGITRAWKAALAWDFSAAYAAHPLFWLAPFALLLPVHMRPLSKYIDRRVLIAVIAALTLAFLVVYMVRLCLGDPVVAPDMEHSLWRMWAPLAS